MSLAKDLTVYHGVYVAMVLKKMAATLKASKLHAQNVDVKNFHEHYRVLPWAMGPIDVLESIAEVPERQVAKTGKSSIFWFTFFFLSSVSVTISQASTIMAEAITTKKSQKNHRVLHSPPITRKELGLVGKFQNSHVLICLPLYVNKTDTSLARSN